MKNVGEEERSKSRKWLIWSSFQGFLVLFFDIESYPNKMKQFTQINGYLNHLFTSKALKYKFIYRNIEYIETRI